MKTILSTITALSLIYLTGCNLGREDTRENSLAGDTTETPSDNLMVTDGITTNDSLASIQADELRPKDEGSQAQASEGNKTYTETEVVKVDTIGSEVVYDINRRTIEQVDTIGATTIYQVKRTVIKRTVQVDTVTETVDEEQNMTFAKGDYKNVDEKVEKDSVTKQMSVEEARKLNEGKKTSYPVKSRSIESDAKQRASQPQQRSTTTQQARTAQDSTTNAVNSNRNRPEPQTSETDSTSTARERETPNEQDTTKINNPGRINE